MPGAILHAGATVLCQHGGQALPTQFSARVLVSGNPITTIGAPYAVLGCPLAPAAAPCATAQWVVGALRVLSEGKFVTIATGVSVCIPTGTPLVPQSTQTRVLAT
jgi:hypothetical protein